MTERILRYTTIVDVIEISKLTGRSINSIVSILESELGDDKLVEFCKMYLNTLSLGVTKEDTAILMKKALPLINEINDEDLIVQEHNIL